MPVVTVIRDGEPFEEEVPAPVPAAAVVPQSVTPRQLQLALLAAGRLDDIEEFVASDAVPRAAKISWNKATEYRRDDPMLNEMAGLLPSPMPPEEIDAIFIAGAAIQ